MSLVHLVMSFHSLELWRPLYNGNEEPTEFPVDPEIFRIDNDYIIVRVQDLQSEEELFAKGQRYHDCPIHHVKHSCFRHNLLDLVNKRLFSIMLWP